MSSSEGPIVPPKAPWNIAKIKGDEGVSTQNTKVLSEDWPSLEETAQKVRSLSLDTKINSHRGSVQSPTDSIDSGTGGELIGSSEKSPIESSPNPKLCDSKWSMISSSEDGQSTSGASSSSNNSSHDDESFPQLEETRKPVRNKSRSSENGNSISSDEITESDSVPQKSTLKKKKSSKPNWIPLTLPDLPPLKRTANFRHRQETRERERSTYTKPVVPKSDSPPTPKQDSPKPNGRAQAELGTPEDPATSSQNSAVQGRLRGQNTGPKPRNNSSSKPGYRGRRNTDQPPIKTFDNPEPYLRASSSASDYMEYSPELAAFSPVFPMGSEFVMPYLGNEYFSATPVSNSTLITMLRNQIEYYFSEENLSKDFFLRRKMDSEGYLPIHLIASFQRVQNLTQDLDLVMEAVRSSTKLEVNQGCVRTVNEPLKWPICDTGVPISPLLSIPVPCAL